MLVWVILIGLGGLAHLLIILAMLRANWLFSQADHDAEHAFNEYIHEHQQAQRRSA